MLVSIGRHRLLGLESPARETILAHARDGHPEEVCGALLGHRFAPDDFAHVLRATAVPNGAERRRHAFRIGSDVVLELERAAARDRLELLGFYHSHPHGDSRPSCADLEQALPWYRYIVISGTGGSRGLMRAWRLREDRSGFEEQELAAGSWTIARHAAAVQARSAP